MPKDVDELKRFMSEEWEKIPQETVQNITLSMKRRCELILQHNGIRIHISLIKQLTTFQMSLN